MEDNVTSIGMEFVDEAEQKDENKNLPTEVKVEEKPGFFKRVWLTVTFPGRWVVEKVKESPASAAIGMVVGAGATLGVKAACDHFGGRHKSDANVIEVPDDGEEYAYSGDTSEENAED